MTIVFGVAFTGLMIAVAYKDATAPTPQLTQVIEQPTAEPKPPTVDELLVVINNERTKSGVAPLTLDTRLNGSAQRKADEMARENRYDHANNAGVRGYTYGLDVAPECREVSENFYWSNYQKDAGDSLNWWKTSTPHYTAILNNNYDATGFGISENGDDIIVVEHFCDK